MQEPRDLVFTPFRLDLLDERLWRRHEAIRLRHKAFAVLRCLVSHAGQLVTKEALLALVWSETVVSEGVLTTAVRELRQALDDQARTPRFIETVHGRGYRFLAPVTAMHPLPLSPAGTAPPGPGPEAAWQRPLRAGARADSFVGRETEGECLHQWYTTARQGVRQVGFIAGEAGIGKTALVEAFVSHVAAAEPVFIGHGQCIEHYGAGEAYLPLLEALGRLGRGADGASLVELLRAHAPSWLVHLPTLLPPDDHAALLRVAPQSTPARMLRELADVLEVFTAHHTLILVLEDLHWSDTATLAWLAYITRRRDPARVLVLGTYRPVEVIVHPHPLRTLMAELRQQPQCTELVLDALSAAEVLAYLQQRCGSSARLEDLAHVLHQRTSGHPLFLVTLVDALIRERLVVAGEPSWGGQGDLGAVTAVIPPSVRQFIEQHVEQVSSEDQALLEAASVAGSLFAIAAVAAGVALPEEAIEARCTTWARQGRFLVAAGTETWPDGTVTPCYRFRHALYHEVVYRRVSAGRRIRLHHQIGARLERGYGAAAPTLAAALALHFTQGHDPQRAVVYLLQAATNAMRRSAYPEAHQHLTSGLAVVPRLLEARDRTQHELAFQIALGHVLLATKGQAAPEVGHTYSRARALCQHGGEAAQHFRVLYGLGHFHIVRAEFQTARALSEELLTLAQHLPDPTYRLGAHFMLGTIWQHLGVYPAARAHLTQSLTLYDPQQHDAHTVLFAWDLGVFCRAFVPHTLWHLGYPDQALALSHEGLTLAQELAHPLSLAMALDYAAMLHQFRQERDAVDARTAAAVALCAEQGFAYYLAWGTTMQGWARTVPGRDKEGLTQLRCGLAALRATGAALRLPYYLALLAEACGHTGRAAEGVTLLAEALAHAHSTGESWMEAELHRLKGELLLVLSADNHAAAEGCLHQALAVARHQQAKGLELRAAMSLSRLWQQQRKGAEAHTLLAPIYGWFTEGFDTADLQDARALLEELAG